MVPCQFLPTLSVVSVPFFFDLLSFPPVSLDAELNSPPFPPYLCNLIARPFLFVPLPLY